MIIKHNPFTHEKRILIAHPISDWTMNSQETIFAIQYSTDTILVIKNGQVTRRRVSFSTPADRFVQRVYWIGGRLYATWSNDLYVSKDEAQTWQKVNLPFASYGFNNVTGVDSLLLVSPRYTAEPLNGLFFSNDYGANGSWKLLNDNVLADGQCKKAVVTKNYVYALLESSNLVNFNATYQIWRRPLSKLLTNIQSTTEKEFNISLFPNPTTNIFYWNSSLQFEFVKIYDILGRLYPIRYEQNSMDISILPQGTYFLEFGIHQNSIVKKIIKY